jgi:hypothetical protein
MDDQPTLMSSLRRLSDGLYDALPPEARDKYAVEVHEALKPIGDQYLKAAREGDPARLVYLIGSVSVCLHCMIGELVRCGEQVSSN